MTPEQILQAVLDGFGHLHLAVESNQLATEQQVEKVMSALTDLTTIVQKLQADFAALTTALQTTATAVAAQKATDDANAAAASAAQETAIGVQVAALQNLDGQIVAATPQTSSAAQ